MNDFFLFVNCPKFVKLDTKPQDMIGEQIRQLRESNDIRLRELAAELQVDQAVLSNIERGERSFRRDDIYAIVGVSHRQFYIQKHQSPITRLNANAASDVENHIHQIIIR